MKKLDILLQIAKELDDCRNQLPYQGVPIPDSLRYRAVQLLETYTTTQVMKLLQVCGSQIKSWLQQLAHHSDVTPKFIALSVSTESISSNSLELELKLSENTSFFISDDVPVDLLRTVI